ncbi:Alkane hydroxylase MAH1 [Camellia lanceoleosa]|uniref:Alkane hydroxylase MAH1 n=1 Tax=Camellia lanceoleosa TaxID=1840588 RepID=A0ACC0J2I0_9ERIC|nr:Alkane hydroxylase MAH1 [Camellia lanceoleosa]
MCPNKAIVDLQDLFQRFTFDTTCILITSYDPGYLSIEFPDVPFAKAMNDAKKALLMRHIVLETVWRIQSWLGIEHEKKLSEAWKTLHRHPTIEEKIIEELKSVIPEGETEKSRLFEEKELRPRTCLGKGIAYTQMKAVSPAIIHNYNVRVVEGHPVVPNASIILYMKHGLKVRVANRWI